MPSCPDGFKTLWQGYSLLGYASGESTSSQDLGRAGSCVESFDVMSMMSCDGKTKQCFTQLLYILQGDGKTLLTTILRHIGHPHSAAHRVVHSVLHDVQKVYNARGRRGGQRFAQRFGRSFVDVYHEGAPLLGKLISSTI